MKNCHYCQNDFDDHDLRPYGPNGALVCYSCAMATPERIATTKSNFDQQLGAALAHSSTVIIGGPNGPVPHTDSSKLN